MFGQDDNQLYKKSRYADMQCNQARHKPMIKPRMTKCITSLVTDQCKEMPRTQIIAMKMKCEINHIGNQRGE